MIISDWAEEKTQNDLSGSLLTGVRNCLSEETVLAVNRWF